MGQVPMLFTLPRVVQVQARVTELCAPAAPPPGEEELAIMWCDIGEDTFTEKRLLKKLAEALARFPSLRGKQLTAWVGEIGGNYNHPLTHYYRTRTGHQQTFLHRILFGFEIFDGRVTVGFIHLYCRTPDWPQQWPLHHGGTYPVSVPVAVEALIRTSPSPVVVH